MKIETKDTAGRVNGWVLPLWSALEHPELRPDQVYVTAIAPHSRKGPHLHMKRRGVFYLVGGIVRARYRLPKPNQSIYDDWKMRVDARVPVIIEPGIPCALYNYGATEALVINMPSPAWSADDPDEWPVEDWEDPPGWQEG